MENPSFVVSLYTIVKNWWHTRAARPVVYRQLETGGLPEAGAAAIVIARKNPV